jgi:hypothetical protein
MSLTEKYNNAERNFSFTHLGKSGTVAVFSYFYKGQREVARDIPVPLSTGDEKQDAKKLAELLSLGDAWVNRAELPKAQPVRQPKKGLDMFYSSNGSKHDLMPV